MGIGSTIGRRAEKLGNRPCPGPMARVGCPAALAVGQGRFPFPKVTNRRSWALSSLRHLCGEALTPWVCAPLSTTHLSCHADSKHRHTPNRLKPAITRFGQDLHPPSSPLLFFAVTLSSRLSSMSTSIDPQIFQFLDRWFRKSFEHALFVSALFNFTPHSANFDILSVWNL